MKKCCIANLELAQDKIKEYLDDSMSDDYLKASENAIADIDTVIFQGIANKQSEWISVKDRLPDNRESGQEFYCSTPCRPRGWVISWTKDYGFMASKECPVTHWMPLPKPPSETRA